MGCQFGVPRGTHPPKKYPSAPRPNKEIQICKLYIYKNSLTLRSHFVIPKTAPFLMAFTLNWKALASARNPYRVWLLLTYKNSDFGAISGQERSRAAPISKVERHLIWERFAASICAPDLHRSKPLTSVVHFNLHFHCFQGQAHCYVTIPIVFPANKNNLSNRCGIARLCTHSTSDL